MSPSRFAVNTSTATNRLNFRCPGQRPTFWDKPTLLQYMSQPCTRRDKLRRRRAESVCMIRHAGRPVSVTRAGRTQTRGVGVGQAGSTLARASRRIMARASRRAPMPCILVSPIHARAGTSCAAHRGKGTACRPRRPAPRRSPPATSAHHRSRRTRADSL